MRRGWYKDSQRHSLAARGIKTSRYMARKPGLVLRGTSASTTAFGRAIEGGAQRYQDLSKFKRDQLVQAAAEGELRNVGAKEIAGRRIVSGAPLNEVERERKEEIIASAESKVKYIPETGKDLYEVWNLEIGNKELERRIDFYNKNKNSLDRRTTQLAELQGNYEKNPSVDVNAKISKISAELNRLDREDTIVTTAIQDQKDLLKRFKADGFDSFNAAEKNKLSSQVRSWNRSVAKSVENSDKRIQREKARDARSSFTFNSSVWFWDGVRMRRRIG